MKLNYRNTFFVGLAFFLICAFWQAYDNIIPKILTDKFGMSQSMSGLVMGLDNVLALFMLPLFGLLSDKSHFRRGRRTPYIMVGTIAAVIAFALLSFADLAQLRQLGEAAGNDPSSLNVLYQADLTITQPSGREVVLKEAIGGRTFCNLEIGSADWANYVTPARQAYARLVTQAHPAPLIFFLLLLVVTLLSMGIFRAPAVALMPDVTPRPLRSRANAVINLMGAVGGILVLVLGLIFHTGAPENALMAYLPFFLIVAAIMIISLLLFLLKVDEPRMAQELSEATALLGEAEPQQALPPVKKKLPPEERRSLLFLLLSVFLWFLGYNAVTSKYSVYAGSVLNLDFNLTLIIAQASAIVSYLPVGLLASRLGRKACIQGGILLLAAAFLVASFLRAGAPMALLCVLFALAGIGWAAISVNSFPMVVELCSGADAGRFTGFYYTASMLAQTITPYFSGLLMDLLGMTALFPYGCLFVLLSFFTLRGVRHGDSRPDAVDAAREALERGD